MKVPNLTKLIPGIFIQPQPAGIHQDLVKRNDVRWPHRIHARATELRRRYQTKELLDGRIVDTNTYVLSRISDEQAV